MAWCAPCRRYLTPATLDRDGSCPSCGGAVQHPPHRSGAGRDGADPREFGRGNGGSLDAADPGSERIPWHFWLLLAAAVVYLGWRALQGVALLLTLLP